jgi:hypothetical protein
MDYPFAMPRAKSPDPLVEEYEANGRTYRLEAFKDGGYNVFAGDELVAVRASQLAAYFGAPRWPSLRLQAEAMEAAKLRARGLREDQH